MGTKKTLALLLVFIMVFGIISSAYAASAVCSFCRSTNTVFTGEDGSDPDLYYSWKYKPYSGSGPHYMREERDCWHSYHCRSCGEDFRVIVRHYGPWVIDTDWVD